MLLTFSFQYSHTWVQFSMSCCDGGRSLPAKVAGRHHGISLDLDVPYRWQLSIMALGSSTVRTVVAHWPITSFQNLDQIDKILAGCHCSPKCWPSAWQTLIAGATEVPTRAGTTTWVCINHRHWGRSRWWWVRGRMWRHVVCHIGYMLGWICGFGRGAVSAITKFFHLDFCN